MRRFLIALGLISSIASAQVDVLTQHNDNYRTGANLTETLLKTSNVTPGRFGKLFERPVIGQIYAQPLIVSGLTVGGRSRNVVYVATMGDQVYAFDADDPEANEPLWHRNFLSPSRTTIPYYYLVGWTDIEPEIGILGTPVIDKASNTMWVVVRTLEGNPDDDASYKQRLHALDIRTGADKPNSPILIQASANGTGDAADGTGRVVFNGRRENQRPALTLVNGTVYIGWASHGDTRPYHGWVIGYDGVTLKRKGTFNTTPNAGLGGIWMSGQGFAVDDESNLYFETGNGNFNPAQRNYGDSIIKLSTADGKLAVADYFTPYNQDWMELYDVDLGSVGNLLIPGTNLLVGAGKEGKVYLMDRTNMGKYRPTDDDQLLQWFWAYGGHLHGAPVYYEGPAGKLVFLWSENDRLKGFRLENERFITDPALLGEVLAPEGMPGAMLSISANGAAAGTGLVWVNMVLTGNANQNVVPGVIRVFDATTANELWNSRMNPANDDSGLFAKYCPPTIANGKVYIATFSNKLNVYGLLPQTPPKKPAGLIAKAGERSVRLQWNSAFGAASYEVLRRTNGGSFATIATDVSALTFIDTGLTSGTTYIYGVKARNPFGLSGISNVVNAVPFEGFNGAYLTPTDDATVQNASGANTNYGGATQLVLDSTNASKTRYAYLKFDISKLHGEVTQATLRLYGARSETGTSFDDVFAVEDTSWTESTVTWNTKPLFGSLLGTTPISQVKKLYDWDVSAYIEQRRLAGAKFVTLGMLQEGSTKRGWVSSNVVDRFNAKESGLKVPQLVVRTRPAIDYSAGFSGSQMTNNGSATVTGSALHLTQNGFGEAGSSFFPTKMLVTQFKSKFTFRIVDPGADGMTFTIQGNDPNALGPPGGGLGYGPDNSAGGGGIPNSVAIKFDIYNNEGEGGNSTGLYLGGVAPTVPSVTLEGTGIDLRSGHSFSASLEYAAGALKVTLEDLETGAAATQSYSVDIPSAVGSDLAYVGFTAGTGGLTATHEVQTWTFGD